MLTRYNGPLKGDDSVTSGYNPQDGKVFELITLADFNRAVATSGPKVMCVCFHNGSPTPERAFDSMKAVYPNVHLYKVNTLNSEDIKNKYADGGAKPYFKFYERGTKIDELPYTASWSVYEPIVRDALARHQGLSTRKDKGSGKYDSNDGKVMELRNL